MRNDRFPGLVHVALLVCVGPLMAQQEPPASDRDEAFRVALDPRLLPPEPATVGEPSLVVLQPPPTATQDEAPGNYGLEGAILGGAIPFLLMLTSEGMEAYAGFLLIVPGLAVGGLVGSLIDKPHGPPDEEETEPADSLAALQPEIEPP